MNIATANSYLISDKTATGKWVLLRDTDILLQPGNDPWPILSLNAPLVATATKPYYLGKIGAENYYCAEISADTPLPAHMKLVPIKQAYTLLGEDLFMIALRALHVLTWNKTYQFCTRCGSPLEFKLNERAKVCVSCNWHCYPKLAPCVIVAITRGKEILLARSPHFPPRMFSVLAGFVEPGETAETTVAREVMEEVGIQVKNIQYFSSQPWPFPDSFMLGFTAEYDSGEIQIDGLEIEAANWFTIDNLPPLPYPASISRHLIDFCLKKIGQ